MHERTFADDFESDVASHSMKILRDRGVDRYLRFKRPQMMCMYFDIITGAGHLSYIGDMGTYLFQQPHDMFQFFRRPEGAVSYVIDLDSWAKRVIADDRCSAVKEFNQEKFKQRVRAELDRYIKNHSEKMPETECATLRQSVENLLCASLYKETKAAYATICEFQYEGNKVFPHFQQEADNEEYTYQFVWCCHALQWSIAKYDAVKRKSL